MVSESGLYDVYWTPDFTEDVAAAVEYVAEVLGSPKAAEDLLTGIVDALESRRAVPQAAASYEGSTGSTRYIASYRRFDIHYVIEERAIKVIGLKHQLQGPDRTTLPGGR